MLEKIQKALKVPKNQYNKFGEYHYRSAATILEAVKPLMDTEGLYLTITDDVINHGDRYYIKATVTVYTSAGAVVASTSAFAREPLSRKGMDESQITGAASSYARKYALNGIFAIDDTKDADSMPPPEQEEKLAEKPEYPQESFDKNFPAWVKRVDTGMKKEQIIKMIETKNTLTETQKQKIMAIGAEA